jgi:NAD(P)-dependent dehydrogenase (short-subunit alcohol dehydrogenase family)
MTGSARLAIESTHGECVDFAEFWRCEGKPALRLSETIRHISSVAGRAAAAQAALDNATKFAVTGATEAWRQEFTTRNVRFSVI